MIRIDRKSLDNTVFESKTEHFAALHLARKIIDLWPDLESNHKDQIEIFTELKLDAGQVEETDFLIVAKFSKPRVFKLETQQVFYPMKFDRAKKKWVKQKDEKYPIKEVAIKNFLCVVEVKRHSNERVKVINNDLQVRYFSKKKGGAYWKSAMQQSKEQREGLIDHIGLHIRRKNPGQSVFPFVAATNFSYLLNVEKDLGATRTHIKNDPFKDILERSIVNQILRYGESNCKFVSKKMLDIQGDGKILTIGSVNKGFIDYCIAAPYSASKKLGRLDLQTMDRITKGKWDERWLEDTGKRMVIFKGTGGTGKTIILIQIAHRLYEHKAHKTLFLTYNLALIANLKRTMSNLKIPGPWSGAGGIYPDQSVMSFMLEVMKSIKIKKTSDKSKKKETTPFISEEELANNQDKKFSSFYKSKIDLLTKYIEKGNWSREQWANYLKKVYPSAAEYDLVFIDEGQDWLEGEKMIIELLFGEKNIFVAHGTAQETRGKELDWSKGKVKAWGNKEGNVRVRTLRKALRMTPNLALFIKSFAKQNLLYDRYNEVEINENLHGGDIFIVEGDYFADHNLHYEIMKNIENDEAKPVDILHCVPSSMVNKRKNTSTVGKELAKRGYDVWDAITDFEKKSLIRSPDTMRVVQYDSCRGLEGWITINYGFDEFWNNKIRESKNHFRTMPNQQIDMFKTEFESEEQFAQEHAARWALIALTRSVKTIVIEIKDKESHVSRMLHSIYQKNKDYINWIEQ